MCGNIQILQTIPFHLCVLGPHLPPARQGEWQLARQRPSKIPRQARRAPQGAAQSVCQLASELRGVPIKQEEYLHQDAAGGGGFVP